MPANNQHTNLIKLPHNVKTKRKRITTVDDLLTRDNVNEVFNDLNEVKPHIKDAIVIFIDRRDNQRYYSTTKDTMLSTAVWLLEATKNDLLNDEDGED